MQINKPELKQNSQKLLPHQKIGTAIFMHGFPQKIKEQCKKITINKILKQQEWKIDNNKYIKGQWSTIFPWIQSTSCKTILLNKNSHEQIIQQISGPQFTFLTVLNLESNRITNVEALAFIDCSKLQTLKLQDNLITDMKPIKKTQWTQLSLMNLSNNPIKKLDLSRLQIGQVNFLLILENKNYSENFMEDINVLFKPQLKGIVNIYVGNKNRQQKFIIFQKKIPKMIKRRWPDKSIAYFKDLLIY